MDTVKWPRFPFKSKWLISSATETEARRDSSTIILLQQKPQIKSDTPSWLSLCPIIGWFRGHPPPFSIPHRVGWDLHWDCIAGQFLLYPIMLLSFPKLPKQICVPTVPFLHVSPINLHWRFFCLKYENIGMVGECWSKLPRTVPNTIPAHESLRVCFSEIRMHDSPPYH